MNKVISTPNAPKAIGPYSQAILAGNTLYCSGQIAINPQTDTFIGGSIVEQTEQILKNIEGLLSAAGFSYNDVSKPARSCVAAKDLPKGALVEIEVIAVKG